MYNIEFYEDANGHSELWDFLEELRLKAATNKDARIQLKEISLYIQVLEDNGTRLNVNITKDLDDDIWELRPGNNRVLYFYFKDDTFVLLHQFRKKTQKTPKREIERAKALPKMLITSGFSFEGYRIVKYSGYISGDDAIQIDRGTASFWDGSGATNVGEKLMQSLTIIRRNALRELKEAAYDLGCNAVIGVDFDYLTLDPQTATSTGGTVYQPYVFGVTANGNAVIIEKIEDDEA